MSILVPELRLLFHEEQARTRTILEEREREELRKPVIPEERANAKGERRELSKRRPGGTARIAVVLVPILLLALVGAVGAFAQPTDRADRTIDTLLAQAVSAGGTAAGVDVFAGAQAECRTISELEQLQRAAPPDYIVADDGSGPKSTITPPPHSPAFGWVTVRLLPRRDPAYFQLERIARCLRELSWSLGALQLRLESQLQQMKKDIAELKRDK